MKGFKKPGLIAIFCTMSYLGIASAIDGSDISWSCIGNDSFLISVAIYNDCNVSPMGYISVNFKCSTTGTAFLSHNLSVPAAVDVTPVCQNSCSRCDTSSCNFPYGVRKYLYQKIISLNSAGSCCNINIALNCYGYRSTIITTGPGGSQYYSEAMMNRCQNPCDFSPQFSNQPVQIYCTAQDVNFYQGMTDSNVTSNGSLIDSFSYELAPPLSAANTPVSYNGSYSYTNPIYYWGFPNASLPLNRGLHLDPQTGLIQFRPMKAEVTVMVVKVSEYRNGTKIAELRREMEIIVINCTNSNPPIINSKNNARSWYVCAGDMISKNFWTTDPNANDSVTLSYDHSITGATWSDSNGLKKLSNGIFTWIPADSQVKSMPYVFYLIAKDNSCPIPRTYIQSYQITVYPKPSANIVVSDSGCGINWFSAQPIQATNPGYLWSSDSFIFKPFNGSLTSHKFKAGKHPYRMTITATGCSSTYYDTLLADSSVWNTLPPDTIVCYESTVKLTSKIEYNKGPVKIQWGSGKTIFSSDTGISKTLRITKDTLIWSIATDSTGCWSKDSIHISMYKPIGLNAGPDIRICSYDQAYLKASYLIDSVAVNKIIWTYLINDSIVGNNRYLTASDSGLYSCSLTDTIGCTDYDTVRVIKNPEVIASVAAQIICIGDEATLVADSTGGGNAYYSWYEGKKLIGSKRVLKVSPLSTTDYILKVMDNLYGVKCSDSTVVRIRVNTLPVISISAIDKRCLNGAMLYLNSYVTVDGSFQPSGIWSSSSAGLIYGDKFNPSEAGVSTPPGWMVKYEYTDPNTGCYNKDSAYVTVLDIPKPDAGSDDTICSGAKIALTGLPELPPGIWTGTGVEGVYPDWKFNPDAPGIADGGTYDAIYHYKDNNNCENDDTIRFTVFKGPGAEAGSAVNICFDAAPFTLNGLPSGGVWSGKGVAGSIFYPSIAGAGVHILMYSNSNSRCTSVDSAAYTVIPEIPTPQIIFNSGDSTLECSLVNGNYAWFYTPDTFTAATSISSNTIKIDPKNHCKKCYFGVVFSDSNGCVSDTSAWYYFAVNSIFSQNRLSGFRFYPNPAHSELFIENPLNEPARIVIADIFGKNLYDHNLIYAKSTLSVRNFKPGIYFIFLNGNIAGKLLIE